MVIVRPSPAVYPSKQLCSSMYWAQSTVDADEMLERRVGKFKVATRTS